MAKTGAVNRGKSIVAAAGRLWRRWGSLVYLVSSRTTEGRPQDVRVPRATNRILCRSESRVENEQTAIYNDRNMAM